MPDLTNLRSKVTDRLPDVITDQLPGTRRTGRLSRLRTPLIVTAATAGTGLLVAAGKFVFDNRFRTGESVVQRIVFLDDGRAIVVLRDVTFVVSAADAEGITEFGKPEARVRYEVLRWNLTGITTGRLHALDETPAGTDGNQDD